MEERYNVLALSGRETDRQGYPRARRGPLQRLVGRPAHRVRSDGLLRYGAWTVVPPWGRALWRPTSLASWAVCTHIRRGRGYRDARRLTTGPVGPPAGPTSPLQVRLQPSPVARPLMRPASRLPLLVVGLRPGGRGPCTPAAAHRPDSTPHAPLPMDHHRPARRSTPALPSAPGPVAPDTAPARRPVCGHTGPRSAPPRPRPEAHGGATARCTVPGVSPASAAAPGPQGLWPARSTGRPPAGHRRRAVACWR
jgi:hypothetical protein